MLRRLFSRAFFSSFLAACAAFPLAPPGAPTTAFAADAPTGDRAAVVSFELDVMPILSAKSCNAGPCHGKSKGQNGFRLSLLGFDPDFDHVALTKEGRGRRIFLPSPERSLLLQKATGELPHGGGVRIERQSTDYETIRRWITQGAPRGREGEPKLAKISVTPREKNLEPLGEQPIVVTATYSDGTTRDVTSLTSYQSNEAGVVNVERSGLIKAGPLPGEATVMARYMNLIDTSHVIIPMPGKVPDEVYAGLPRVNFIDDLIWAKLKTLGLTPSAPVDDAKFLRRVHIDLIGRVPTPDEVREFLADKNPNKRAAVVDRLLERPEYADHWAGKWADMLRPNPYRVGIKAVLNYDHWIRDSFRKNKPYDQFVRELITAQGSTWRNGAVTMFRDRREPDEITTLVSQLFLGIRLECAKCHHHPFEKWGQDDFYSFAAFFSRLGHKGVGLSPPISGGEEMILTAKSGAVKHPLTQEVLPPRPLFGQLAQADADVDPREQLAAWISANDNPFFAQVAVNRIWADLMGKGIVEPIDDLRATNPPSNPQLLEALAAEFRKQKYDTKQLLRTITTSYVYGLSSLPGERNASDNRNYSRHYRTRLRAETLLDAISDITGLKDSFGAMPPQSRSTEIWTTRIGSTFLDTFGRPNPNQDPPCERTPDATVTQTLHLMNAPQLHQKVTADASRAAQLAASDLAPAAIVEQVYLLVYNRLPETDETAVGLTLFAEKDMTRRRATEDLMWALLNTPEFMFKD